MTPRTQTARGRRRRIGPDDVAGLYRVSPAAMAAELSRPRLADGGRGEAQWRIAPHLRLLSGALVDAAMGRHPNLIVTMPPRHGKSELTSVAFPVWLLEHWPDRNVILASYEADFAAGWGGKVRDNVQQNTDLLSVRLKPDSTSKSRWETHAGGGMVTAGVGGAITGRGANALIIDDPIKNMQDAKSKIRRQAQWDWYTSTARTRLEPGACRVIVMTRWHEDDLVGRLLSEEYGGGLDWRVIHLPALAEPGDALGRAPGEALWPWRYDEQVLAHTKAEVGAYVWGALYQGHPVPVEGDGLWTRADVQAARGLYASLVSQGTDPAAAEALVDIVVGVDPPGSETTECGIVVCGRERARLPGGQSRGGVLDDRSLAGTVKAWSSEVVRAFYEWGAHRVVAEKNYGGNMVKEVIRHVDAGVPITVVTASAAKRIRAEPVQVPYTQARMWHRAHFPELEDEMVQWHPDAGYSPNRLDAMVWAATNLKLAASTGRMTTRDVWES